METVVGEDITVRLRGYKYNGHLLRDAADEIDRLRSRLRSISFLVVFLMGAILFIVGI